jgi:hypothetical protein
MANVPSHQDFKHKVHAKAYKAAERNGVVWVYMGDQADVPNGIPGLPPFEASLLPEDQANVWFVLRECSWLQGLEGDMDTSHLGFLHYGKLKGDDFSDNESQRYTAATRAPDYLIKSTDWGVMYAALRAAEEDRVNVRVSQFVLPFWTMPPLNPIERNFVARAWVPVDDTHHMFVSIVRNDGDPMTRSLLGGRVAGSNRLDYLPNTTDWLGRWRIRQNRANDYMIDRAKQRSETFTGIEGITQQDFAVTDSMGDIAERTLEHLAASDGPIAQTRRTLIQAARALAETGALPPSARRPDMIAGVRGGFYNVARGDAGPDTWLAQYGEQLARAPFHTRGAQAAE